jgi:outer membrane protein OmpA-like peptidoglycan-associated protein
MKKLALVVLMLAAVTGMAQQPMAPAAQIAATNLTQRVAAPSMSDVYCAGFITNQLIPETSYVVAGWSTPHQTKYMDRDYIYIQGGSYPDGTELWVVRHLRDPNQYQAFPGQIAAIASAGEPYADLGRVRVVATRNNITIAQVEFACEPMNPGDVVTAYAERAIPPYHRDVPFDRFAVPNGKLTGRILMARDFDVLLGTGRKVYLNVGSGQGVKVGDYFRVVRDYQVAKMEPVEALSYKATTTEDTQKKPPVFPPARAGELPRRSLGEAIVVGVSPKSSTVMLTYSLEDILVGDSVEMMEPIPPLPPPAENAPTISCSANPATVRVGENSHITSDASSPDNRPLAYSFAASAGNIAGQDNLATLDTRGASAGPISVRCTATDDRNLSASAMTTVNVEAPPAAPVAALVNSIQFKPNSAYVDNKAKAILDDLALRLARESDSSTAIVGMSEPRESKTLAARRAANAKTYLTKSKGIDAKRVETQTGAEAGKKADLWIVPAGASMTQ